MIIAGREVVLKQQFDEMLDEILAWYISQGYDQFARKFMKELHDAIVHKIAPFPERHSEYPFKKTPDKSYRRYIFRKKYYVIFKVMPQKLEVLAIVYSKRDLNKLPID
ncbi:MAG: hypothetical protein IPM82_20780 [Saprospiraceae bacterium]|nr:hypothetical protein [Saprospiraceae bacterium]